MDIALGCKPHTGWAVAVLVATAGDRPIVLDRRRIALEPAPFPAHLYHHAQTLPAGAAGPLVDEAAGMVERAASAALSHLTTAAAEHGRLVAVGIVGEPRDVPALDRVLRSHALLHLAEGELYRGALDDAARGAGLQVALAPAKGTITEAAIALGRPAAALEQTLVALRAELGPPWQADHRAATAAGLLALSAVAS